jgi:hypothetical protein
VARQLGYTANTEAFHHWVSLKVVGKPAGQLLFSFHQAGRNMRGVFIASAFFERLPTGAGDSAAGLVSTADRGFVITLAEELDHMRGRFAEWLDAAVNAGVAEWSKQI